MAHRVYTDNALDLIIAAAGGLPDGEIEPGAPMDWDGRRTFMRQSRRDALRQRLEAAAEQYIVATWIAAPSQRSMAAEYQTVHESLRMTLRKLLPADRAARDRLHVGLSMRLADADVRRRLVVVAELYHAAGLLHRTKKAKPKRAREDLHLGDRALNALVRDLMAIWAYVFGRDVGTSTSSGSADAGRDGRAGGPMVRYLIAALTPVVATTPSESAIRARVRRILRKLTPPTN